MVLSPYRAMIVLSHVMMIIPQNDALVSCKKTNATSVIIPLSCPSTQWIHVRSETYGNTTLEQGCLDTTNSCTQTVMADDAGLIVNCNGKQRCYEFLDASSVCTPVSGYEVIYDCVEDTFDICTSQEKSTLGVIYLHSPGFPDNNGINASCTCRITGRLMLVQLIEHQGRKKDLNISTDGNNLGQGVNPVNRIIVQRANHATLNYQVMEDGRFWIKVTGLGMIDVKCSIVSNDKPSTSMSTTVTHTTKESSRTESTTVPASTVTWSVASSESNHDTEIPTTASPVVRASTVTHSVFSTESNDGTETPRTDDLNSTAIVGGICGVIILILIIVIVLLVYFKVLKPSRGKAVNTAHVKDDFGNLDTNKSDSHYKPVTNSALDTSAPGSDEQTPSDANNTYSGLSQYENQDGQHEYGRIHVYGNTRV